MDVLKKQASKFKVQVAKQQLGQAVIKQFGGSGYESSNVMVTDEVELQRHQQLQKLYGSTRSGRDFQKDIIHAVETFTTIGIKHIETGTKLSEDCYKYGRENINDGVLAKPASVYGGSLIHVEKEHEELNKTLSSQVIEPLKAMANGVPLEDARHLAQRYSRLRQEAETLAAEVSRRQSRVKEAPFPENTAKLHVSESKLQQLKTNMAILGKEAAVALSAVESQQQRLTLQRLLAMIDAEKSFHLRIAAILDEVQQEISSENQRKESMPPVPPQTRPEKGHFYLAEVLHPFHATSEKELSLAVGDYIVVRKMTASGWAEGECKGRAGWFPVAYVERRHNVPTNKVAPGVC